MKTAQLFCLLFALTGAWADAAPLVHVRARAELAVDAIDRVPEGIEVRGRLLDGVTRQGISGHVVRIDVQGEGGFYEYAEPSREDGAFRWRVPLRKESTYRLRIAAGDGRFLVAPATFERAIDLHREPLEVKFGSPNRVSSDAEVVAIDVIVRTLGGDHRPLGNVPVQLSVGGRSLGPELTRDDGHVLFALNRERNLLAGSELLLIARTQLPDSDDRFGNAEASHRVLVAHGTRVEIDPVATDLRADEPFTITGRVRLRSGEPLANEAVSLKRNDDATVRAQGTTDRDGAFAFTIEKGTLPAGRHVFTVAHPPGALSDASVSPPITISLAPPSPPSPYPYLIPPLALIAAVLSRRVAKRLRALAAARAERRRRAPVIIPGGTSIAATAKRPSLLATLRAPSDHTLAGQVLDPGKSGWGVGPPSPLPTAIVTCTASDGTITEFAVDFAGQFSFADVPRGSATLSVSAPGYAPCSTQVTLPHRGELRAITMSPEPLRARIFRHFAEIATEIQDGPSPTVPLTPREVGRANAQAPHGPWLLDLVELVETACYGAHSPYPRDAEQAAELAARVRSMRNRRVAP